MITAGVDIGSVAAKVFILGEEDKAVYLVRPSGFNIADVSRRVLQGAAEKMGIELGAIDKIVATGYGRNSVPFECDRVTEITCSAAGARHLYPNAELVIDIGGQDSKVIKIGKNGAVQQFAMNDKCAAGTGKFLEVTAGVLETSVEELGELSLMSKNKVAISNVCTVFAQTEIVNLIAQRTAREDIAAALNEAIASRVFAMVNSVGYNIQGDAVMTGGVAYNKGIVKLLGQMLDKNIVVPPNPQIIVAMGAAVIARNRALNK